MKALLTAFSLLIAVSFTSYGQDTTNVPSTQNYFLSFVKKVYLNPTILLKTQNFRSQHNVRVMLLPDMNGQTDNTITAFERAMQKIIRFLIEGDDAGTIRLYFDASDASTPFSFVASDELHCKFSTADKDSITRRLNAPFKNVPFTINSHTLFETALNKGLEYAGQCLIHTPAECGEQGDFTTTTINTKPLSISVHNTAGSRYDIDQKTHNLLESHYAKAEDLFTQSDWYAPAKFMLANKDHNEPVAIAINRHETPFRRQNLTFRTVYNEQVIPIEPNSTDDTVKIRLPKTLPPGAPLEVVVTYKSPIDSINYTVGFFMVYVYEAQPLKVNVIGVNNYNIAQNKAAIDAELKKIYDPVGVTFEVITQTIDPDSELPLNIAIESSGLLSNYPADLRGYVNAVKDMEEYESDEYYIVYGLSTTSELTGYMPRARNIGFVFSSAGSPGKVTAHELGHGAFHLRHLFSDEELGGQSEGTTANLMDYATNPNELYLHQWKGIDDPGFVSWTGGDDEEGAYRTLNNGQIPPYFRNADSTVSFLTPSLQIVRLPKNVKYYGSTFGITDVAGLPLFPSGVLWTFTTEDGTVYKCAISGNTFTGYFTEGGLPFPGYIPSSTALKQKDQVVFNYYALPGAKYVMLEGFKASNSRGMYTGGPAPIADLSIAEEARLNYTTSRILVTVPWSSVEQKLTSESPFESFFASYMPKMNSDDVSIGKQVLLMSKAIEYMEQYPYLIPYVTNSNNINQWDQSSRECVNISYVTDAIATIWSATDPIGTYLESISEQPDGPESVFAGLFDLKVVYHNWDKNKTKEELLSLFIKTFQDVVGKYQALYNTIITDLISTNNSDLTGTITKTSDYIVTSNAQEGQKVYSKMQLRNTLSCMSGEQLSSITPRRRANLVAIFLSNGETLEIMENEVVKMFETCPGGTSAVSFLLLLEKYERPNGRHILGEMLDKIDDETCFIGTDNFTDLCRAFCVLYNNMYNRDNYAAPFTSFFDDKIAPFAKEYQKYSDVKKIKGAYITYNYSSAVWRLFKSTDYMNAMGNELITEVNYNEASGKIFYKNNIVNGFWINGDKDGRFFSPLEPIIFDDGGKVFSPYGYNSKDLHPYPAIMLYFAEKKAVSKTATDLIQFGVDVITFIIPGGGALKIVSLVDKACAAGSIISSMTQYTHPDFSSGLALASGLMGLATLGPNDIDNLDDLGRHLHSSPNPNAAIADGYINDIANRMKPVENYENKVRETCQNVEDATSLNPESKEFLQKFLQNEKRLAQVENKFELVARINQTLVHLGSAVEASNGLSKIDELVGLGIGITKVGDDYKLLGRTLGRAEGGKLKMNREYMLDDFTGLDVDAQLVAVLEDVDYTKGWMGSTTAVEKHGDILLFKKDSKIFCLDGVNCFAANTLIQTENGPVAIENIAVGDVVRSFDEQTAQKSFAKVTNVFKRSVKQLQRVVIGKDVLYTTPEHPFYNGGKWITAANLAVGLVLQSPFGTDTVTANDPVSDTSAIVFNFTVAGSHTYVVGNEQILVHNNCEKIAELSRALPDQATRNAFHNALRNNSNLAAEFVNGTVKIEDWKLLIAARGLNSDLANDILTLKKVGQLRKKPGFMSAIGGEDGFRDLLQANVRARCVSCGTAGAAHMKNMDEYLADVDHFIDQFANPMVDGFGEAMAELKKMNSTGSPNFAMEGAAFMVDYIRRTPQINKNSVARFDGAFDFDPDLLGVCTNCRFDIEMVSGLKYEFKSYAAQSIQKIGSQNPTKPFLRQHLSYLTTSTSVDRIRYIFDPSKMSGTFNVIIDGVQQTLTAEQYIKHQFKLMYMGNKQAIFDAMHPDLKQSLNLLDASDIDATVIDEIVNKMVKL